MSRLWLAESADRTIRQEARKRRLVETGGPLFGYQDESTGDTVVVLAHGPGPKAKHRPFSFVPDRVATQEAIRAVHAQSDGVYSYVGEWHTHPGGSSQPSGRDLRSLAAIASEPQVDLAAPAAIIVPTVILRRRVRVREPAGFRWSASRRVACQLAICVSADAEPAASK